MAGHCEEHTGLVERIDALSRTITIWGKAMCVVIPICAGSVTTAFLYVGLPAITQNYDLRAKIAEEFSKRDLAQKETQMRLVNHEERIVKLERGNR